MMSFVSTPRFLNWKETENEVCSSAMLMGRELQMLGKCGAAKRYLYGARLDGYSIKASGCVSSGTDILQIGC